MAKGDHNRGKKWGAHFTKGASGNPGGVPKEEHDLRRLLAADGKDIHDALMDLVRAREPVAVIYAHRQLVGEPPQTVNHKHSVDAEELIERLTDEELDELEKLSEAAWQRSQPDPIQEH